MTGRDPTVSPLAAACSTSLCSSVNAVVPSAMTCDTVNMRSCCFLRRITDDVDDPDQRAERQSTDVLSSCSST